MSSKEVLTLQFGNYSNHVGTHFWNLQYDSLRANIDSQDGKRYHSKLMRETSDCRQFNAVPRMITVDSKQCLRTLKLDGTFDMDAELSPAEENEDGLQSKVRKMNGYYDPLHDDSESCVAFKEKAIKKNEFLVNFHSKSQPANKKFNIEDKVNSWTDYMSYTLHENSLQMLRNRFEDEKMFTYHGLGCMEYNNLMYDLEDKLHYWIEECNSLDGFMLMTDVHDGFSGITSKMLEELHEEYRSKTVLPYVNLVHSEHMDDGNVVPWLNTALTLQSFHNYSTMFVVQGCQGNLLQNKEDIAIPNLTYKADVAYHSSAILASAIDSATQPWREEGGVDMLEHCLQITQDRFKLASNSIGFPLLKHSDGSSFFEHIIATKDLYDNLVTSLFPFGTRPRASPLTQSVVFDNVCGVAVPSFEPKVLRSLGLNYDIFGGKVNNFFDHFIERMYPSNSTVSNVVCTQRKSSFSQPVASMLNNCEGSLHNAMSSLFTSSSFHGVLQALVTKVQRLDLNKHHLVRECGHDKDTHKQLVEDLYSLAQEYDLDDPFRECHQ